ncbi:hypothetical protein LY78DRAFT_179231 [Colletotrichum sublineola]|nr:hypothetical protein LY78DRAFT_179231 [Colletotrichum sublineola]
MRHARVSVPLLQTAARMGKTLMGPGESSHPSLTFLPPPIGWIERHATHAQSVVARPVLIVSSSFLSCWTLTVVVIGPGMAVVSNTCSAHGDADSYEVWMALTLQIPAPHSLSLGSITICISHPAYGTVDGSPIPPPPSVALIILQHRSSS